MFKCEVCGSDVEAGARGRKPRFCSGRCRVANHRAATIPAELIALPRWIRHKAKRPMTVTGFWASSTDPKSWSTYADAKASQHGDGIGFVLNGDGIVCIDLDHCLTDGRLTPVAQMILDATPGAYAEISPSGHGLHIWGRANLDKGYRFELNGQFIEIYPNGRYLTVTGRVFRKGTLTSLDVSSFLNF